MAPFSIKSATLVIVLALAGQQPAKADETITYTYDSLGRLVAAKSSGTVNNNRTASYCYEKAGNRKYAKSDATGVPIDCSTIPTPTPPPPSGPSITINNASATEGSPITFTVSLSAASTVVITVDYATAVGSAQSNDFTMMSGTLTFTPGQTSRPIVVATTQDTRVEATEVFTVNLTNPTGDTTIGDSQGVGSIIDNDDADPNPCPLC